MIKMTKMNIHSHTGLKLDYLKHIYHTLEIAYSSQLTQFTPTQLIRDAPLDFKGGGAGSLGQDKFFFFSSLARKVFLYFQYLMGQVLFFLALDGASFFF